VTWYADSGVLCVTSLPGWTGRLPDIEAATYLSQRRRVLKQVAPLIYGKLAAALSAPLSSATHVWGQTETQIATSYGQKRCVGNEAGIVKGILWATEPEQRKLGENRLRIPGGYSGFTCLWLQTCSLGNLKKRQQES
jgi:hypothetical protein